MNGVANGWQNVLLAFSALLSIVNPVSSALIFARVTADRTHAGRVDLARRVGLYAALVMLVSLWGGADVLDVFGISLAALRIAGGLVVAVPGLGHAVGRRGPRGAQGGASRGGRGRARRGLLPLTMPFTTAPGTMSVAIAPSGRSWVGPRTSASFEREERQDRVGEPTRSC